MNEWNAKDVTSNLNNAYIESKAFSRRQFSKFIKLSNLISWSTFVWIYFMFHQSKRIIDLQFLLRDKDSSKKLLCALVAYEIATCL